MSFNTTKYLTVNRKRNLPFFLGWYDHIYNIDVSTQVSSKGIDLLIPYVGEADKEKIQAFLDTSKKAGVKVLLEIYRPLVESENILGVKHFIRTYKNHPSVYGWYLYDEPEIKKPTPLSPDLLKKIYQAIKEEDNSKPVALVFADIKKIESYADTMDILMWDRYPCEEGVSEFEWVLSYRKALYKVISLAYVKKKKFWNVLQAYSKNQFKKRLPTKREFRYMFYLSVLTGADGLLFWTHYLSSHFWNESVLYPTIQEFRDYVPAIVRGEDSNNQVQVNHSDIEVKLFSIPNTKNFVMIAVNHNDTQINLTVKLPQKLANKLVTFNQNPIAKLSAEAGFSTILEAYEVRLYQIGM
ncbi:glycoside hydrolase family 2 TIM barrel-domain containing protein [Nostoc sp. LEGE 12447]|uniref:glycoside hydrolase family 2 TIM barrel-domain containing protein n=1 Tax=Nostoc sp. LEGE 12447 TaxID=1828640 RepID=UPI001D148CC0|nr:glycoside hydrolase family 2 TIM barrel-domain containing protein [Nostoc sp. LEGE 12447]